MAANNLFVGIGSSGGRALRALKEDGVPGEFIIISDRPTDLREGLNFLKYREDDMGLPIKEMAFTFSSLTGNTGPYIAHHISSCLRKSGSYVVSIVYSPLSFHEKLYFKASNSLRRIRRYSDMILIVDNFFFEEIYGNCPMEEFYRMVNRRLSRIIRYLVLDEGLFDDIMDVRKGVGIIISSSGKDMSSAIAGLLARAYMISASLESSTAIVSKGSGPSPNDLKEVYKGLSMLSGGPPLTLKSYKSSEKVGVDVIGRVKGLRLEGYDPIAKILKDRVLDEEPEFKLRISLPSLNRID